MAPLLPLICVNKRCFDMKALHGIQSVLQMICKKYEFDVIFAKL